MVFQGNIVVPVVTTRSDEILFGWKPLYLTKSTINLTINGFWDPNKGFIYNIRFNREVIVCLVYGNRVGTERHVLSVVSHAVWDMIDGRGADSIACATIFSISNVLSV